MNESLLIAELLLKYGPGVARGVAGIFQKTAPTLADWELVFGLAEKSYEAYVAEAKARAGK